MAVFNIGETVICSVEIRNSAGTLVDPSTSMQIKINQLSPIFLNTLVATSMTPDSTGKYHYDFVSTNKTTGNYQIIYVATDGTRVTIKKENFSLE